MSADTPPAHSSRILKLMLVFAASILLLSYCSWRVYHNPLQSQNTIELSPQLKKRLSCDILEANPDHPGERFDLKDIPITGKTTIVEFYSLFSPECIDLEPQLEMLSRARPDLAIRKINIDRPDREKRSIDLNSPLAKQYEIKAVPEFKIYDADQNLLAEGEKARREVDLCILKDVAASHKK